MKRLLTFLKVKHVKISTLNKIQRRWLRKLNFLKITDLSDRDSPNKENRYYRDIFHQENPFQSEFFFLK